MPIKGDILTSSFSPQIRLFDTATGSKKLKAGVTELVRAEYNIRFYWYAEPSVFDIFSNGGEIVRKDGKSFLSDGFQIGEGLRIQFGFGASGETGTGTINAISEDGFTLFTTIGGLTNGSYDSTVECLITGLQSLDQAIYRFGLIENEESFNTNSKLTGEDQKYFIEDITGAPTFGTISGNIIGWASSSEAINISSLPLSDIPINRDANFGGTGIQGSNVLNYNIQHTFPILPYYVVGQLNNIKNLISPSFLAGNNSLKHVFELTFKNNITDEENNKTVQFQSLDGSIGFFDELFNGLQSQYSIESVDYVAVSSGLSNPSLLTEGLTEVTILLNSANGTFTGSTPVIATHSYLPLNEDEYLESQDYFNTNFAFENTPKGAGGSIITSVTTNVITPNEMEVVLLVDVSGIKPDIDAKSNYLLSVTVEDETLPQSDPDRTVLLADVNTYDENPDIPDLFIVDQFENFDHVTDITATGNTDYKGWIQDGYAVKGIFKLDRSKFAVLSRLFIDIVAVNDSINESFTIQSNEFDLSNQVIVEGNQQINIQETQGFELDTLDQFNQKAIVTGAFDGTFIEYAFLLGLKINWQDWLSLPDADTIFYDPTEPNNGLNQNSSRYNLKEGYQLKTILRADVLESAQNITTEYITRSDLNALDFDEFSIDDWTGVITTKREDTGADTGGSILGSGNTTIITATFTPNFVITPDPNDYTGIIRIVEQLPQSDKTITELSSVRSSQPNNLLIPLDGEALTKVSVIGSTVVLECRTDKTLVENITYTLSARLLGPATAVIVGDFNDDFSNDFFV